MDTYDQVFSEKIEFKSDLSVVDVLFNLGPETTSYLETPKVFNFIIFVKNFQDGQFRIQ